MTMRRASCSCSCHQGKHTHIPTYQLKQQDTVHLRIISHSMASNPSARTPDFVTALPTHLVSVTILRSASFSLVRSSPQYPPNHIHPHSYCSCSTPSKAPKATYAKPRSSPRIVRLVGCMQQVVGTSSSRDASRELVRLRSESTERNDACSHKTCGRGDRLSNPMSNLYEIHIYRAFGGYEVKFRARAECPVGGRWRRAICTNGGK
jgi:hypothetical protein